MDCRAVQNLLMFLIHFRLRGHDAGVSRALRGRYEGVTRVWRRREEGVTSSEELVISDTDTNFGSRWATEECEVSKWGRISRAIQWCWSYTRDTCRSRVGTCHVCGGGRQVCRRNTEIQMFMFLFYCTCLWINSIYVVLIVNGHQFAK